MINPDLSLGENIKLRLIELADMKPDDDVMTLCWSPLKDHGLWEAWAAEVERQMEAAWQQGFLAGNDSAMSCGYSFERALGYEFGDIRARDYPLDLAPDDWKAP